MSAGYSRLAVSIRRSHLLLIVLLHAAWMADCGLAYDRPSARVFRAFIVAQVRVLVLLTLGGAGPSA